MRVALKERHMSRPVIVNSRIILPDQSGKVTVALKERGAAHVGFGIDLFLRDNLVRHVVVFPDEDDVETRFALESVKALRALGIDCFGRVFSGASDDVELYLSFAVGGKEFGMSDSATFSLTPSNPSREFHIRCLFV
jgi:hypothetical protein